MNLRIVVYGSGSCHCQQRIELHFHFDNFYQIERSFENLILCSIYSFCNMIMDEKNLIGMNATTYMHNEQTLGNGSSYFTLEEDKRIIVV